MENPGLSDALSESLDSAGHWHLPLPETQHDGHQAIEPCGPGLPQEETTEL